MGDDLVYVGVLAGSLALGKLSPALSSATRPFVFALAGVLALLLSCGAQSLHALATTGLALAVLRLAPVHLHGRVCAAVCFTYVTAMRLLTVPRGPTNAVQLMLTLRLTMLGFESTDGRLNGVPSHRLILYISCMHGLFTGPCYTFDDWSQAMGLVSRPGELIARRPGWTLAWAFAVACVWQGVVRALPYKQIFDETWSQKPLLHRVAYFFVSSSQYRCNRESRSLMLMWPVGESHHQILLASTTTFRLAVCHSLRFYVCWLVMEAAGCLVGFTTPSNVDVLGCELATKPSAYIVAWNTSVASLAPRPRPRLKNWCTAHV